MTRYGLPCNSFEQGQRQDERGNQKQICGLMGISGATLHAYVEEFSKHP